MTLQRYPLAIAKYVSRLEIYNSLNLCGMILCINDMSKILS